MESNQTNISPDVSGIPQGIPTGVFVPNNQTPPVQVPVQDASQPVVSTPVQAPVAQATEGPLDKILKSLVRFFAKIMGQPDPITGVPNVASQTLQQGENIVGKVRGAANQVVSKATDAATQGVNIATNVANQATQQIQQIIPPPVAAPQTQVPVVETPVVEIPVSQPPVAPPTV